MRKKNEFKVHLYDEMCEPSSKIEKIIGLRISSYKLLIYLILNLFTLFFINLLVLWYHNLRMSLIFEKCGVYEATHFGILGSDNRFYIASKENLDLPNIDDSPIKRFCSLNLYDNKIIHFNFKLFKYIYLERLNEFVSIKFQINTSFDNINKYFTTGLNVREVEYQKQIFGSCDLQINIDSIIVLILKEVSDPFYVFQIFSIILWYYNEYGIYASVILITTIISIILGVYEVRTNLISIKKMAKYSCPVSIFRVNKNGVKELFETDSSNLIPGDLFELPSDDTILPCDAILINGTVIVNESMLTGESIPIIKTHISTSPNKIFDYNHDKSHIIYSGTKILQKRSIGGKKVLGLVLATGFNTEKGNLIRSILYPKDSEYRFQKDSVKYIILMSCLTIVGFLVSIPFMIKNDIPTEDIILRCLDLITTTVPPALPACLGIGISYALERLKKKGIMCINRSRVNIVGKINMICFDKTGTLTEDHLDVCGYRPLKFFKNTFMFEIFLDNIDNQVFNNFSYYREKMLNSNNSNWKPDKNKDINSYFVECLATCHSLTKVNGKIIGDPIDIEMFESTGWVLKENLEDEENYDSLISTFVRPGEERDLQEKLSQDGVDEDLIIKSHYEVGIVRRFDFSSNLQRMTVLVKNVNENSFKVYSKGSPEKIKELCRQDTIPENFTSILAKYTMKGLRVLALSMKMLKMNYMNSQKMQRENLENNMIFLGLMIVQNKLKPKTKSSIDSLLNAQYRMLMATGDNILTAISVARECFLIKPEAPVYMCEITKEGGENILAWNKIETFIEEDEINEENKIGGGELSDSSKFSQHFEPEVLESSFHSKHKPLSRRGSFNDKEATETYEETQVENIENDVFQIDINYFPFRYQAEEEYSIAITGTTFQKLVKLRNKYLQTHQENYRKYFEFLKIILKSGIIYARMSPEHKTLLIDCLKEENFYVCMCGDGANDCGALRTADVGVSLSLEEASIAAHFTSKVSDISCLIKLLREGKASLVTSIQCFKYMILYSLIQFFSVTILLVVNTYLTDNQFLSSDLFIVFPLAVLISRTGAHEKLTPHQPTGVLISVPIITSILLQSLIQFFSQYGIYFILSSEKWFTPNIFPIDENSDVIPCYENTAVFLVANVQYLITAVAFSIGRPFKKPIYTNFWLSLYLVLFFFYSYWIIIYPDEISSDIFSIVNFPDEDFKYLILIVSLVNFILSYLIEKLIVPCISEISKNRQLKKLFRANSERKIIMNIPPFHSIRDLYKD